MQAWLRRWRWRLFVVAFSVIAIAWVFFVLSRSPDSVQIAFDRIGRGMTKAEVDGAMTGSFWNIPTETLRRDRHNALRRAQFTVTYYFDHSKIIVDFDTADRVEDRAIVRFKPTMGERFRHWLARARTALKV
jgi:hypothetical protein